ncbi:MAG: FdhF/YdeP family oxidoreductase [Gammaproteobacteria bacterium]|nr:FdhF/YdeP family oxidoreductase [Gammaproteobacteria bacterium]MDH3767457.1 FdhF/YdeP family oxidoreductase [Gammaproteobacteria bacterium]
MTRTTKPGIRPPKEAAGGITSVVNSLSHAFRKAGPVRGTRALLKTNQSDGFDCPGCAWPEAEKRAIAEFCENGAKAVADEAMTAKIKPEFFGKYSVAELRAKKGRWLNAQGRLTHPMVLREGDEHYSVISWDDAFELISGQLKMLQSPDEAVFYTSGRTSNEAAFLYQLLARRLGTNNLPDCSNLCHESSGRALGEAIGTGKGTVTLDDFELADAIFIAGQNPGSNHPRMLATLQRASRRGAHIVSINPLDETGLRHFKNPQEISGYIGRGTLLADLHIPVSINGDVALFQAIAKALLENVKRGGAGLDCDFIADKTTGFDAYREHIQTSVWGLLTRVSGVDIDVIRAAAEILAKSKRVIFCWAMGLTQHRNAIANIQEIVNLLLLGGHFGRPGSGVCPVRGHSNVQGDRTMGIWEKPTAEFLQAIQREFRFSPPQRHGYDTVESIHAMRAGKVKVFVAMGGNFVAATPDTEVTEHALARCRLSVQISTKLNRSHLYTGRTALILPALGRSEFDIQAEVSQFVTVENSMGMVRRSAGVLPPVSQDVKSEVRIVSEIGRRLFGEKDPVDWALLAANYDDIRDRIARVIPGFENCNEQLQAKGEFLLPHPVRDEQRFPTATGKALFTVHPVEEISVEDGQLLLTSVRSHDQFNTTVYTENDRYRGIKGSRHVVFANRADLLEQGLVDGMLVDITSHFGEQTRVVKGFRLVEFEIPRGCLAAYYPEINPLVPLGHVARISNTPAYKSIVVSLKSAAR